MRREWIAIVAAGILPAVEPWRPARRTFRSYVLMVGKFKMPLVVRCFFPGGGTPALHVRRDA